MKKIFLLIIILFSINSLMFGYEDYYEKVYVVKISKEDIFKEINATEKQKNQLNKIFDNYKKEAQNLENKLLKFEDKKEELGKLEKERYIEISKVLTSNQILLFNQYLNNKKLEFENKNDKLAKLLEKLNLTNEQKSVILKNERDFQRNVNKLDVKKLSFEKFASEYDRLQNIRNNKIKEVLSEEQILEIENLK